MNEIMKFNNCYFGNLAKHPDSYICVPFRSTSDNAMHYSQMYILRKNWYHMHVRQAWHGMGARARHAI